MGERALERSEMSQIIPGAKLLFVSFSSVVSMWDILLLNNHMQFAIK